MTNLVPGSGILGKCFNARGVFDADSPSANLFDLTGSGREWVTDAGVIYELPKNTNVIGTYESIGQSNCFSSRREVEEHFSQKTGLSVGYMGFKAKVDALYSKATHSDTAYSYALYEMFRGLWKLELKDYSPQAISDRVRTDPDYSQIPTTFSPENRDKFFSFFDKYGTHFICEVDMGGLLYYALKVMKAFTSDKRKIEMNVELEFKATFLSTEASSHTEWEKLSKNWVESRTTNILAEGGNSDVMMLLIPEYEKNYSDLYKEWLSSISQLPHIIEYKMRPISQIFPLEKRMAVEQAINSYLNWIHVASEYENCMIAVKGRSVRATDFVPDQPFIGLLASVISKKESRAIFTHVYKLYPFDPQKMKDKGARAVWNRLWDQMHDELKKYCDIPDTILVLATYRMRIIWFPNKTFQQFLRERGAGKYLDAWENSHKVAMENLRRDETCNYCFIGYQGKSSALGFEQFTIAASRERGDYAQKATLDIQIDELNSANSSPSNR